MKTIYDSYYNPLVLITDEQHHNLLLLQNGLRYPGLWGGRTFNMGFYSNDNTERLTDHDGETKETECGPVACAIGLATILVEPKKLEELYYQFSERVFGIDIGTEVGQYLFSSFWKWSENNTAADVADRIETILTIGLPEDHSEQVHKGYDSRERALHGSLAARGT